MKLKSSDSLSVVLMAFAIGSLLSKPAEAFPQTTKAMPAQAVAATPAREPVCLPSPLSGMDAKLEPAEYYSTVIPVDRAVTYEIDLRETLLGYSLENKCSTDDAFHKLADQLGMRSLETVRKPSQVNANPATNAFYKLVKDDVYAISANQDFFNVLGARLSNFQYGDKQIVIEVRFLEIPQSDISMLKSFTIPGTFQTFGAQLPIAESLDSEGTFANQRNAGGGPKGVSVLADSANGTFARATETRTKAYPTFIGRLDDGGRQQLVKLSKSRSAMSIAAAPKVIVFPGQRATVSDYASQPFVVSVNEHTDGEAIAHQPVIQLLENGTKLTVQADLQQGKLKLSGDLAFSKVLGVELFNYPMAQAPDGDSSGVTVQIPEHQIRNVNWSSEVAADQTIVIDSVETYEAEVKAKTRFKAAKTRTMRRLVLITPRIIVQKEELADQDETQNLNR